MFCRNCGNEIADAAVICLKCGVATGVPTVNRSIPGISAKSRTVYVLLGLFLGCLGIHNFYAGYNSKAVAQLLITLILGWWLIVPWIAVAVWAVVEVCTVTHDAQGIRLY